MTNSSRTVRDLAAFGVSKARLHEIAEILSGQGKTQYARDLRATADFIEEVCRYAAAADAFTEIVAEWGRQNAEPIF